ncbi:MAG: ATP-binding cassette domain-containing protein [candidate division Zixibacteria bacterium]|nr:ATP-binding cassette domain-containing protein [candidate division Zixibacteria bacterium]
MRELLSWLWRFWRKFPKPLALILTFSVVNGAIRAAYPYIMKYIFDGIEAGFDISTLYKYVGVLLGVGVFAYLIYLVLQGTRAYMNMRLEFRFRQYMFEYISKLSPSFFNRYSTGDLVTRLTDDITEKLAWFSCSGVFRTLEAFLMVAFGVVAMLTINAKLTLFAIGPLPLLVFIFIKTATILHKRFDAVQKAISRINDVMESCFSGIKVIKAYNRENAQKDVFSDAVEHRKKMELRSVYAHGVIHALWGHVWQLGVVIILLVGGKMVMDGTLTIGEFVAFDTYVLMLIYPMFDIGQFVVSGRRGAVSVDRLRELEKYQPEITQPEVPVPFGTNGLQIEFENVSFSYDGETRALDKISFTARPGEMIALVGTIGSGKSTVLNLVPRLFDPTGGTIKINGHDLKMISLEELRRVIGYVPQEPLLFSDTIENNVVFHRDWVKRGTVEESSEIAQLSSELSSFKEGFATRVGARGVNLSGGQKQRVSLARALAGTPKLLLLDDCTASLDAVTERKLWDQLNTVMPKTTCLLVSHRTNTVKRANQILVFDQGKIVERGSHEELIAMGGLYKRLYEKQLLIEAVHG